jgi:hypothetical protein
VCGVSERCGVVYLCVVGVSRAEGQCAHVERLLIERFRAHVVGLAQVKRGQIRVALRQLIHVKGLKESAHNVSRNQRQHIRKGS